MTREQEHPQAQPPAAGAPPERRRERWWHRIDWPGVIIPLMAAVIGLIPWIVEQLSDRAVTLQSQIDTVPLIEGRLAERRTLQIKDRAEDPFRALEGGVTPVVVSLYNLSDQTVTDVVITMTFTVNKGESPKLIQLRTEGEGILADESEAGSTHQFKFKVPTAPPGDAPFFRAAFLFESASPPRTTVSAAGPGINTNVSPYRGRSGNFWNGWLVAAGVITILTVPLLLVRGKKRGRANVPRGDKATIRQ